MNSDEVRTRVRDRYGKIAKSGGDCGCAPSCCDGPAEAPPNVARVDQVSQGLGYSVEDTQGVPQGANLGLGCGNPQAIAALKPGETVLDLGSGAGFDAFLAARAVGKNGHVIGVDMTPEMVAKAKAHRDASDLRNIDFRLGEIENLPVADGSVDVIISNCVINLSPDKQRVFHEAFRVLKVGGRVAISDVVAHVKIPEDVRRDWDLYTGCVAGASTIDELSTWLAQAGFVDIRITPKDGSRSIIAGWFPGRKIEDVLCSAHIEAVKPAQKP